MSCLNFDHHELEFNPINYNKDRNIAELKEEDDIFLYIEREITINDKLEISQEDIKKLNYALSVLIKLHFNDIGIINNDIIKHGVNFNICSVHLMEGIDKYTTEKKPNHIFIEISAYKLKKIKNLNIYNNRIVNKIISIENYKKIHIPILVEDSLSYNDNIYIKLMKIYNIDHYNKLLDSRADYLSFLKEHYKKNYGCIWCFQSFLGLAYHTLSKDYTDYNIGEIPKSMQHINVNKCYYINIKSIVNILIAKLGNRESCQEKYKKISTDLWAKSNKKIQKYKYLLDCYTKRCIDIFINNNIKLNIMNPVEKEKEIKDKNFLHDMILKGHLYERGLDGIIEQGSEGKSTFIRVRNESYTKKYSRTSQSPNIRSSISNFDLLE